MEEPLEQEHSIANDDLKPSSSTTTSKSSRSTKQTTANGTTRRHKRRRQTNSTRSSSDRSTSSSRSSSTSSHSSHSSIKNSISNEHEIQKTRSYLAQEQLQTIVNKTKTGKFDILDGFSFLSFETDEDWRIAYEHFNQQQLQRTYTTKKSHSVSGKKNGHINEHSDGNSLPRSISVPCKIEDTHRPLNNSVPNATDDTTIENHRSSMWQNGSPSKNPNDRSASVIKTEPTDQANRTTSEHGENRADNEQNQIPLASSQKSKDDVKVESNDKKHHHHHHHHKSHKRHKTKHDLSINGDSSNKHPTITSMSDLAKQHIKNESIPHPLNFPPQFDPKLFPMSPFPTFGPHAPPPPPTAGPFGNPYDPSMMLASRLYGGQYPRDLLMPPPPRPPSRSLQHPFSIKENHPDASMEKMLEKYYPGVLPGYLAAAASAAAAASTNSNSPVSSLNVKMHANSPNGPDHPLWAQREALQRQFLSTSNKPSSNKSPIFDSNTKLPSNHSSTSPIGHHHRRHSSSTSNPEIPPSTTPSTHPLYLAPVIVTEFHQHQHNHNHTHEHKLNITTKDERQSASPRSKTPLSNENKKMKTGFSVTDMFIDKSSPIMKHSPQSQGFLSVVNNKKETNSSPIVPLKKPSNGKWSTAHVHIAWMIFNHEQRQRDKLNLLNQTNKVRPSPTLPSSQPTLLPPPIPLSDTNNDLSLLRPPMPPPPSSSFPFPFPFDVNTQQNPLLRLPATKLPRPTVTPSSTSSSSPSIKTQTIKREQKLPYIDERIRRASPSPLSRSTSSSNFLPPSPSHRMKMDFPSLLLPPPPPQQQQQQQHSLSPFPLTDDRKRFLNAAADFLPPFGPSPASSPFLSSFFPMAPPPMPPPLSTPMPPPIMSPAASSSSRRSGINSDSPKSLFPPPPSAPFDFTRSPLLSSGLPLPNNHLEADRYRFLIEQQARDRDLQYAMLAAAAAGNAPHPPPPLFTDPNASALFKHYSN